MERVGNNHEDSVMKHVLRMIIAGVMVFAIFIVALNVYFAFDPPERSIRDASTIRIGQIALMPVETHASSKLLHAMIAVEQLVEAGEAVSAERIELLFGTPQATTGSGPGRTLQYTFHDDAGQPWRADLATDARDNVLAVSLGNIGNQDVRSQDTTAKSDSPPPIVAAAFPQLPGYWHRDVPNRAMTIVFGFNEDDTWEWYFMTVDGVESEWGYCSVDGDTLILLRPGTVDCRLRVLRLGGDEIEFEEQGAIAAWRRGLGKHAEDESLTEARMTIVQMRQAVK